MIPWSLILKHAPIILKGAETLYSHATSNAGKARAADDRISELEAQSRESARLLQEIAQQLQALTEAQQAAANRARLAVMIASVAVVGAIAACVMAISW